MIVTSDTLFHFTKSRNNLERILSERFKFSYCKESYHIDSDFSGELYIPMISFCDLPLGLIKNHITKYGSFGIGMTKEWGIKNKLNPVLYLEKKSLVSRDFNKSADLFSSMVNSLEKLQNELTEKKSEHITSI